MPGQKIKVGILIDDFLIHAWLFEMLQRINESDYAAICIVVKNKTAHYNKEANKFNTIAYRLHKKIENKGVKFNPDALALKNSSELFKSIKVLEVENQIGKEDVAVIQTYKPDVFIKLGFKNLSGDILKCSKGGVWAYTLGNYFLHHNAPAGVWEVIEKQCQTEIALKIITENKNRDLILYSSFSSTNSSIKKNINIACWKAVSFVPRKLKELHETGLDDFTEKLSEENNQPAFYTKPLYKTPENSIIIAYLFKHYFNVIKNKAWRLFNFEQWILMFSFNNKNEIPSLIYKYHKLVPPKDRFWADPFLFSNSEEKHFIFFEEYLYKTKKAHISVIEVDKNGKTGKPQIVLDKPYHLSYPFIFSADNKIYMIPETSANKTIEIYKCVAFPHKWEFEMNLMENLHAVDTTIHYYNNKYWLFANIKENKGASAWDELFLFYSDALLTTTWQPHPQNPVISDVKQARPAGKLFTYNNKLYRPSQDSSCTYGFAISFNEVLILNEKEYLEKKVTTIFPNWDKKAVATHTFSYSDNLTVIDARLKRSKYLNKQI